MKLFLPEIVDSSQLTVYRIKKTVNRQPLTVNRKSRGFTLIELLVVIGILTILLAIVLIAINPAKQFAQANNTQRRSDVNAILNGIHQYAADNKGQLPTGIDTTERELCRPVATCGTVPPLAAVTDAVDICTSLVETYLAALPRDPDSPVAFTACGSNYNTGYSVVKTANNRITVKALTPESEGGGPAPTISVTR